MSNRKSKEGRTKYRKERKKRTEREREVGE